MFPQCTSFFFPSSDKHTLRDCYTDGMMLGIVEVTKIHKAQIVPLRVYRVGVDDKKACYREAVRKAVTPGGPLLYLLEPAISLLLP